MLYCRKPVRLTMMLLKSSTTCGIPLDSFSHNEERVNRIEENERKNNTNTQRYTILKHKYRGKLKKDSHVLVSTSPQRLGMLYNNLQNVAQTVLLLIK